MAKRRMNSRDERATATKNKIYKSAEELFSKYGFNGVSVDNIVELAKVAKGTFYVHFESKYALIAQLINDNVSKIDMDYVAYLESIPSNMCADEVLILFINKITDVLTNKIGCENMKAIYKAQIAKDINSEAIMGYNRQLYNMFESIIETGINRNELKAELPSDIIARHFMIAFRGITYEWCVRYPDFDLKEQAAQHFQLLISALK